MDTTKTAPHTPGPWKVETSADNPNYRGIVTVKDGLAIAWGHYEITGDGRLREECEANARLMAAAPAMLEALKEAVERLSYLWPDSFDDVEHEHNCVEQMNRFRTVIAQAEGKE